MSKPDREVSVFLADAFGDKVSPDIPEDERQQVESELGEIAREEDWSRLKQFCNRLEDEYDAQVKEMRQFADMVSDPDLVEVSEGEDVEGEMSRAVRRALISKVKEAEKDEMILRTENEMSVPAIFELQEELWKDHNKKGFCISGQKSWEGRISVELSETKEKIQLLQVFQSEDGGTVFRHLGESKSEYKGNKVLDQHVHGFFIYKFVSNDTEYLLFSTEKLDPMTCEVHGTKYSLSDYKQVGENTGIPVDRDIIFAESVEPAIRDLEPAEFEEIAAEVEHDWLGDRLLGDWRHPKWFEKMLLTLIMVNEENGYPSPVLWMADTGTGKSKVVNAISKAFDERADVFSGTVSTVKGLTPSFSDTPPDEGYLLKTNRVACLDEIFNLLEQAQKGNSSKQDVFRPLLDLIEHEDRLFSSGNGSIRGKLDSWIIGAGNDSYGVESMSMAADKLDNAFLGRFLLYEQLDSHVQWIEDRKYEIDETEAEFPDGDEDFISLMDHLREKVEVSTSSARVRDIKEAIQPQVPSNFEAIYRSRYDHHIRNLVCGHAKYRSMVSGSMDFEAKDADYEFAESIIEILVQSWIANVDLMEMKVSSRPFYLQDERQEVYRFIENNFPASLDDVDEEFEDLTAGFVLKNLKDKEVVEKTEDGFVPFWSDAASTDEKKFGVVG